MAITDRIELPFWKGHLHHIFISSGHDYWGRQEKNHVPHGVLSPEGVECVAGMGLRGDRYFNVRPDAKGQVTFFDAAVVEEVRQTFHLPDLSPSLFRRNFIVSGVSLADWKGRRFQIQGVTFEGTQECTPCVWMDRAVAPGVQAFLREKFRGGLRAKVVTSGRLHVGPLEGSPADHTLRA